MKQKLLVVFALIISANIAQAQTAPSIQWQKTYGGANGASYGFCTQQTNDGGYITAGYTAATNGDVTGSHGQDMWIVKTNSLGIIQWQKALGGSDYDKANTIQQTIDGGYIIGGTAYSNNGDLSGNKGSADYWIVKLSSTGSVQWQSIYGGTGYDELSSLQQTTDGGFIVAGTTNSNDGDIINNYGEYDAWIMKLNNAGSIQWQRTYGGSASDFAYSIKQSSDGGYVFTGSTSSNDGDVFGNHGNTFQNDLWVVKLSSVGSIQWQKTLGGIKDDVGNSIQQTTDGGYVIAGSTRSDDGDITFNNSSFSTFDFWIIKLTSVGNLQWQKTYGGTADDQAYNIVQTGEGGYVIAGSTASTYSDVSNNHGAVDYWILKLNSIGSIQWQKTLGGSGYDAAYSIQQTIDGGYIVAGYTGSNDGDVTDNHGVADFWLVKLNPTCVNNILPVSASTGLSSVCVGSNILLTNGSNIPAGASAVWTSIAARATVNANTGVVTGTSAGTAIIKYTITDGSCIGSTTKTVLVNSIPNVPSIQYAPGSINPQAGAGGAFCANRIFTLVGIPSGGVWSSTGVLTVTNGGVANTGLIAGAASLTYTYTNANGCSNSRSIVSNVVICANRGVNGMTNEKQEKRNEFIMYPNPAKTFIRLNVETLIGAGSIVVTDLYGKQVKTQSLSMGNNNVDIANLTKGFYMVSVITSEGKTTRKLVVE